MVRCDCKAELRNSLLIVFQTFSVTDVGVRSKKVALPLFSIKDNQIKRRGDVCMCMRVCLCVLTNKETPDLETALTPAVCFVH